MPDDRVTTPAPPPSSAATVESDIPCLGCGYNLRGLAVGGRCPECSREVDRSLRGDLLRYANEIWVARMYRGLWIAYAGLMVQVLGLVALTTFALVLDVRDEPDEFAELAFLGLGGLLLVILIVGYPVGIWLLTNPDPAEVEAESHFRPILRYTGLALPPLIGALISAVGTTHAAYDGGVVAVQVLAWLHIASLALWFETIYRRCRPGPFDAADEEERRRRQVRRAQWWAICLPPIVIGLDWMTNFRFAPLALVVLWIYVLSMAPGMLTAIRTEREAARSSAMRSCHPPAEPGANRASERSEETS